MEINLPFKMYPYKDKTDVQNAMLFFLQRYVL